MAQGPNAGRGTLQGQATVTAAGQCIIPIPATGLTGLIITGAVTVWNSLPGTVWQVTTGGTPNNPGTPIDIVVGPATCSGVQLTGSESLMLVAQGLQPGTTFNAVFVYIYDDEEYVEWTYPQADSNQSPLPPTTLSITGQASGTGASTELTPTVGASRLWAAAISAVGTSIGTGILQDNGGGVYLAAICTSAAGGTPSNNSIGGALGVPIINPPLFVVNQTGATDTIATVWYS